MSTRHSLMAVELTEESIKAMKAAVTSASATSLIEEMRADAASGDNCGATSEMITRAANRIVALENVEKAALGLADYLSALDTNTKRAIFVAIADRHGDLAVELSNHMHALRCAVKEAKACT